MAHKPTGIRAFDNMAPQLERWAQDALARDAATQTKPWVLTTLDFGHRVLLRDANDQAMSYDTEAEARAALAAWLDAMPMSFMKANNQEMTRVEHRP